MNAKRIRFRLFIKSLVILVISTVLITPAMPSAATPSSAPAGLMDIPPRDQTLYFNGLQWESVNGWNPYSTQSNAMALAQKDSARVTMFETPYLYNTLSGEQIPLLADGPYAWNDNRTEITFSIKPASHWSDGTPLTAADVAYTWDTNLLYDTQAGNSFRDAIDSVTALDDLTVVVKAKLDEFGNAINPLMVEAFLSTNYVIQKAWTQILEARTGGDQDAFLTDPAEDVVWSGPYHKYFADDTIVVLVRDESYWGQDASMWGSLPVPKYLAHVIYPDNDAGMAAFLAGEVDVSQQFIPNVQDLWLEQGLPVSTYLTEAPYMIGASMPTAFYNLSVDSLNNPAIRKAIAIAVDYTTIISDAMSNQSATFVDVPRSLMNPSPGEQVMYDHEAVADLQWTGNDIAGANEILDTAGITDTNADGWREYNGETLHYTATCPLGWLDWQATIEILAAAGPAIGINITTNYPDWGVYQNVVTMWSELQKTRDYDIFMMWTDGSGPAQPWNRVHHLISSDFAFTDYNWSGNWGGYSNPAADAIIWSIPAETDPAVLKQAYTDLTEIYLTDIPSFSLMYRPEVFHTVNESLWTSFPHQDDGTDPPVPPMIMIDGWGIAGLYNLRYTPTNFQFLPVIRR